MTDFTCEHDLKCWPEFYEKLLSGEKRFEIRKNDRGFLAGDTLHLREWDRWAQAYTGRESRWRVTYLLARPDCGIEYGYAVMAVEPLPVQPPGSESREARLEKALRECLTEAENQFQWAQATHCDDCDPGDEGREVWADILGSINRALAPPARPPSPEKQQGFASDQPASGYGGGEFNRPPPEKQRGDKT